MRVRATVLLCTLWGCGGDTVQLPHPPTAVRWVAVLGFSEGALVHSSPIMPVTLGLSPRGFKAAEADSWAMVGWREADGLDEQLVGTEAVQLASEASGLAAASYAVRADAGYLAEDFKPWSPSPALVVPGAPACPQIVPAEAQLSLSCGTDTCLGQARQTGCDIRLNAEGCGLNDVVARADAGGEVSFEDATGCSAQPPDVPGAALSVRCQRSGTTCVGRVMKPGGPQRVRAVRHDLFTPGTQGWSRDGLDGGWTCAPAVIGDRVAVLQRAQPVRAGCEFGPPATLHLLAADGFEAIASSTVSGCTWHVTGLESGGLLSFEGGANPVVQRWSADLQPGLRQAVPELVGQAFFPAAADHLGDEALVLWDDVAQPGPLARATRVALDGTLSTVELDTPRVSGVALRTDGRFVVLDHTDKRVSLHALLPGGREQSYRVGLISRPLRAVVHDSDRFETWIAVGGAVSPQVFVTGPGSFTATPRVTPVYGVLAEPWTVARWPAAPHRALVGLVEGSGAGAAYLSLMDPGLDPPVLLPGLSEVGQGPIVGAGADDRGRVWMALPAEGAVLRVEPW